MQVEIWSDIMCPFCYIGKRRFEAALSQFSERDKVEVIWKSFQLNPDIKTDPSKSINEYLAEVKGWTIEQAQDANKYVTKMAKEVGLEYVLEKSILANSFDAHRFIQMAKLQGKGDDAEEQLFKAYFTDSKNIADHNTLISLGVLIGLNADDVEKMLRSDDFAEAVDNDIYEAKQVGASGVPFFVIDRKFGISGAQSTEIFLNTLNTAIKG